MARIPDNIIEEVKTKNDIIDVLSSYVQFEKKSAQNMFACCPFHDEKTPSFSASSVKQMFYCFGCHKGGDVISFIMAIEHMSYPEAIRFLADRVGVEIPEETEEDARYIEIKEKRKRLYNLNKEAARFFYYQLNAKQGNIAKAYLRQRGISLKTEKIFGLGYAPEGWQDLLNHLQSKQYSEEDIADSGLFKKNKHDRWYDLFRNRLVFPIIDVWGNIVAFGARVLDDSNPKYLNSPETEVYTKGKHLYNLNVAKKTKSERLIIVEGYMDCIALHQAGFDQSVASLGTALTGDQAKLLRKYREEIVLAYDMDRAGRMATLRNIDVLEQHNVKAFVLQLTDAKDPDDFLRNNSPADFTYHLNLVTNGLDYKFLHIESEASVNGVLDKIIYQENVSDLLLSINNPVIRQLYIPKVAAKLEVPEDSLELLLEMKNQDNQKSSRRREFRSNVITKDENKESKKPEPLDNKNNQLNKNLSLSETEAALMARIIKRADLFYESSIDLQEVWFSSKALRPIIGNLLRIAKEGKLSEDVFLQVMNEEDEEIRETLLPQISKLLILDDTDRTDEDYINLMKIQSLIIKQDYFARLSRYYSYLLDHPTKSSEDEETIRYKFLKVREERNKVVRELRRLDNNKIDSEI